MLQNVRTKLAPALNKVKNISPAIALDADEGDLHRSLRLWARQSNADCALPDDISHRIVTNAAAIKAVSSEILTLLGETGQAEDVTLAPDYFVKKNELRCAPVLVMIQRGGKLVAALYGRHRRVLGLKTGIVQFGDFYGDSAVISGTAL